MKVKSRKTLISNISRAISASVVKKFFGFNFVFIFGALGFLKYRFKKSTVVDVRHNKIKVSGRRASEYYTYISLISLLIHSVTIGYSTGLELRGVGFKYRLKYSTLYLVLGFSHVKKILIPANIVTQLLNNKFIKFTGYNISALNNLISIIKKMKSRNVYKNKGIFFKSEVLRLKVGKKSSAL
jgi:large subunit ribosomal protein L6